MTQVEQVQAVLALLPCELLCKITLIWYSSLSWALAWGLPSSWWQLLPVGCQRWLQLRGLPMGSVRLLCCMRQKVVAEHLAFWVAGAEICLRGVTFWVPQIRAWTSLNLKGSCNFLTNAESHLRIFVQWLFFIPKIATFPRGTGDIFIMMELHYPAGAVGWCKGWSWSAVCFHPLSNYIMLLQPVGVLLQKKKKNRLGKKKKSPKNK